MPHYRQTAEIKHLADQTNAEEIPHFMSFIDQCQTRYPELSSLDRHAAHHMEAVLRADNTNILAVAQAQAYARGGQPDTSRYESSSVLISRHDDEHCIKKKHVVIQTWTHVLANATSIHFDCEAYAVNRYNNVEWIFHGIRFRTAYAARTFQYLHEFVQEQAGNTEKVKSKDIDSYYLGIVDGLVETVLYQADNVSYSYMDANGDRKHAVPLATVFVVPRDKPIVVENGFDVELAKYKPDQRTQVRRITIGSREGQKAFECGKDDAEKVKLAQVPGILVGLESRHE